MNIGLLDSGFYFFLSARKRKSVQTFLTQNFESVCAWLKSWFEIDSPVVKKINRPNRYSPFSNQIWAAVWVKRLIVFFDLKTRNDPHSNETRPFL